MLHTIGEEKSKENRREQFTSQINKAWYFPYLREVKKEEKKGEAPLGIGSLW